MGPSGRQEAERQAVSTRPSRTSCVYYFVRLMMSGVDVVLGAVSRSGSDSLLSANLTPRLVSLRRITHFPDGLLPTPSLRTYNTCPAWNQLLLQASTARTDAIDSCYRSRGLRCLSPYGPTATPLQRQRADCKVDVDSLRLVHGLFPAIYRSV